MVVYGSSTQVRYSGVSAIVEYAVSSLGVSINVRLLNFYSDFFNKKNTHIFFLKKRIVGGYFGNWTQPMWRD